MFHRFEKGSFNLGFVHSPGGSEALGRQWEHRERIQRKLGEFLSAQEARTTATDIYNRALDLDEEIGRILKDPLVGRLYEYDGQFFTCRSERLFHVTFDGIHLLEWMTDSVLESFFRRREKYLAIECLLDELDKHVCVAMIRRMNWEEFHTLGMLPSEVLEAILQESRERSEAEAGPPPLSLEEQSFFQSFQMQMERQ